MITKRRRNNATQQTRNQICISIQNVSRNQATGTNSAAGSRSIKRKLDTGIKVCNSKVKNNQRHATNEKPNINIFASWPTQNCKKYHYYCDDQKFRSHWILIDNLGVSGSKLDDSTTNQVYEDRNLID